MLVSPLDVPAVIVLGFLTAFAHKRWLKKKNPDSYVFLNVVFVILLWVNAIAVATGAPTWIFGAGEPVDAGSTLIGVLFVLSYPLWFNWGAEKAFILFGRGPEQGGMLWVVSIKDSTENFEPNWED